MSDFALRVCHVSKRYCLGPRLRCQALRDTLTDAALAPLRAVRSTLARVHVGTFARANELWALKDVSSRR